MAYPQSEVSDALSTLMDFVDDVLSEMPSPLQFLEEQVHEKSLDESHRMLDDPYEIRMDESGLKVASHMINKIDNLSMFETQDDNLRGSLLSMINYEPEKVFELIDSDTGYPVLVGKESSNCFERNCVAAKCRPFRFMLYARASPTVLLPAMQLDKGCSVNCVNKMMKVTDYKKSTIGFIEPKTHCMKIQFNAYDRQRNLLFSIQGDKFQLSSVVGKLPLPGLKRIVFKAYDAEGHKLGQIANEWSGLLRELLGDADDYTINFRSEKMSSDQKMMLLATVFYLDMRYFTSCCSFSVRDCLIKRYTPAPLVKGLKYAPVALQGMKAGGEATAGMKKSANRRAQ